MKNTTILIFGVSNVGKTTAGALLAEKLGVPFFDLDAEVKKYFGITLEQFVTSGTLEDRDRKRGMVLEEIVKDGESKVVAVTPISYPQYIRGSLRKKGALAVELRDTPENIFARLVFSDENDEIYTDEDYKEKYRIQLIREIKKDLEWYGKVYRIIPEKYDMNGETAEETADGLIRKFGLFPENEDLKPEE